MVVEKNIKSVVFPKSIAYLKDRSFWCMRNLSKIVFPKSNKDLTIGERAFFEDVSLTTIENSDSISHLSLMAFASCIDLEEISLLGLKEENKLGFVISDCCFMNCKSLKKVILKEKQPYTIKMQAFCNSGIEEWDFSDCKKVCFKAFGGSEIKEINIGPDTCLEASEIFSSCQNLKNLRVYQKRHLSLYILLYSLHKHTYRSFPTFLY